MEPEPSQTDNNLEGDQVLSEMLDDAMPGEGDSLNPPTDPAVVEDGLPGAAPEPKPEEGKLEGGAVEPQPAPEVTPEPPAVEVKTWEYRGKQYTLEQMIEQGILDDVVQTARQFPGIQTKYQTLLEEKGAAPSAPSSAEPTAPAPPTGDQILHAYTPVVQEMAAKGYIEPEVLEVFPKLATALMYHRDIIYDLHKTVKVLVQGEIARNEGGKKHAALQYVDGLCNEVAGGGEHFEILKDAKVRKGFYEYLGSLNVPMGNVNTDFVKKQWIAYNSDPMLEAVRQAASDRKAVDDKTRRNAKGEGGGIRPAPTKVEPKTVDTALIDSFLD